MKDKEKIRKEIEKRYEYWREKEHNSHSIESEIRMSECQHLLLLFNSLQEEPISKDLEEAAVEAFKHIVDSDKNNFYEIFKAGAKWGTRQAEVKIQAQSMALAHGCPKDFTCSNLEEAAVKYAQDKHLPVQTWQAFKAGAQWQKEQMIKDAYTGIYDCCDDTSWIEFKGWLLSTSEVGKKVKLVIIKEE